MMHEQDNATPNQDQPEITENENVNASESISSEDIQSHAALQEEKMSTEQASESTPSEDAQPTRTALEEESTEQITGEVLSEQEEKVNPDNVAETTNSLEDENATVSEEAPPSTEQENNEEAITSNNEEKPATKAEESETAQEESANDNEEDEELPQTDYSQFSKAEFLELIKQLAKEEDLRKFSPILREMRPMFDEIIQEEKQIALEKFLAEGGEEDGFEFKEDAETQEFYQIYNELQKKRYDQTNKLEREREQNLQRKNDILDQIRKLLENPESSLDELKKLQKEWKEVGPVQAQHNRNLWASYNALLDLFYDQRSIHFELIELDRKKNLALKLALCEKAEKLQEYEIINEAIKELNELHEEFKHIGPVPKEDQEPLWNRFKAASDRVYERKREYHRNLEETKQKNLVEKQRLCEVILPFTAFQSDRITEWNAKTKEILALQKEWETIRLIPREHAKEVSKNFWSAFKTFFNNKNAFLKTIDEEREENLKQKTVLCEEAEQLVNGEHDPKAVAEQLKTLQQKWKDIGPVPAKFRQSIYDRFKATCDAFFERRRKAYTEQEQTYAQNLQKKIEICEKIEQYQPDENTPNDLINEFIKEWKSIGFVPKKDKNKIQERFDDAIDRLINRLPKTNEVAREKVRLSAQMKLSKDSPNAQRKMNQLETNLRRKISTLENEIDVLRNNIGFLARSKKADKLKDSLNQQIEEANQELKSLRNQLKALRQMDE